MRGTLDALAVSDPRHARPGPQGAGLSRTRTLPGAAGTRESGDVAEYVKSIVISQMKTDLERMVDSLSYVVGSFMPDWADPATA